MKLIVFDDAVADAWSPFSLSRPAGELLFGTLLLRERLERLVGTTASAAISRPWLTAFTEAGAPPVLAGADSLEEAVPRVFLCARAVPSLGFALVLEPDRVADLRIGDRVIGRVLPAGHLAPTTEWLSRPEADPTLESVELPGRVLENVWDLVAWNRAQLLEDLSRAQESDWDRPTTTPVIGDHPVLLGSGVAIEPGVLFDTRGGPVLLDRDVEVRAGARIEGPFYAGPRTRLLGGSFAGCSVGPVCRLRGEIADSIILGYSNKAHDGFLGHSVLGRWVNLGAMTTNSNLKNNYGTVRLGAPGGVVQTDLTKLGCLLGDHVKTAIGTLLNTGTTVGVGANLFGPDTPPKWVPPFSWGGSAGASLCREQVFLSIAQTVFGRRDVPFDESTSEWLRAVWTSAAT